MNLRLTDQEADDLRRQAEVEGVSQQDVARAAVREYVQRRAHKSRVAESSKYGAQRYDVALKALGSI